MTAKKAIKILRNVALLSLFSSYAATAFRYWQFNPDEWGEEGRGGFIVLYLTTLMIYGLVVIFIHMFTEEQL